MQLPEPWERRCETCDGSGQVMSLAWAAWHEEYAELELIPDPPSRLRALADHVRRVPTEVELLACPQCGGDGVVVTEAGAALLDFVSRRLQPPSTSPQRPPAQPGWPAEPPPAQHRRPAEPPPTRSAGPDDATSYFARPSDRPMAPTPLSPPLGSEQVIPDWWHEAPGNGAMVRDLPAQSNGPPVRAAGDPWRVRPRPEWRSEDWD